MKTKRVKIGVVGVDSGSVMICDPVYIDAYWQKAEKEEVYCDFAHDVYEHVATGALWQFTYGKYAQPGVNEFPGSYETIIPEYGKTPNQLIASKEFKRKDIDTLPHIPADEFSYRNTCKVRRNRFGAINFPSGIPGLAVTSDSGWGDGSYDVFAEVATEGESKGRVVRVVIEFIPK